MTVLTLQEKPPLPLHVCTYKLYTSTIIAHRAQKIEIGKWTMDNVFGYLDVNIVEEVPLDAITGALGDRPIDLI